MLNIKITLINYGNKDYFESTIKKMIDPEENLYTLSLKCIINVKQQGISAESIVSQIIIYAIRFHRRK